LGLESRRKKKTEKKKSKEDKKMAAVSSFKSSAKQDGALLTFRRIAIYTKNAVICRSAQYVAKSLFLVAQLQRSQRVSLGTPAQR
jgi:hypothetical protein